MMGGKVVLVPFPFDDLMATKVRPAVSIKSFDALQRADVERVYSTAHPTTTPSRAKFSPDTAPRTPQRAHHRRQRSQPA
jgi:hypothetical protein